MRGLRMRSPGEGAARPHPSLRDAPSTGASPGRGPDTQNDQVFHNITLMDACHGPALLCV
jgi:hypothetical protein